MTGRMPIRIHDYGKNGVDNLPDSEITIGELLKSEGYSTAYVGKWGIADYSLDYKGSHPNDQGFDYFFWVAPQ